MKAYYFYFMKKKERMIFTHLIVWSQYSILFSGFISQIYPSRWNVTNGNAPYHVVQRKVNQAAGWRSWVRTKLLSVVPSSKHIGYRTLLLSGVQSARYTQLEPHRSQSFRWVNLFVLHVLLIRFILNETSQSINMNYDGSCDKL